MQTDDAQAMAVRMVCAFDAYTTPSGRRPHEGPKRDSRNDQDKPASVDFVVARQYTASQQQRPCAAGPHTYKQIHRRLGVMRSAGLVVAVKVGRNRRRQWRWMLSRDGVLQASELFFNGAIPKIATEEALKSRLAVLPMLEIFHEIAPTVRRDWLVHSRNMAEENPNLEVSHLMTETFLTNGGLDLLALQWNPNGYPQAVGTYQQWGQTPFVFVDRRLIPEPWPTWPRRAFWGSQPLATIRLGRLSNRDTGSSCEMEPCQQS